MASDHPAGSGREAKRAPRLTPACYEALAAIISADGIEAAAPIAAELLGRPVSARNVAQQMRRARSGKAILAAESMAAIEVLLEAIEGRRAAIEGRHPEGWEGLLEMVEEGHTIPEAADGAGIDLEEVHKAMNEDAEALAGGEASELAALGRRVKRAAAAYRSSVLAATRRGEDTRYQLANLERIAAAGGHVSPLTMQEQADAAQASFNRYADERFVVTESPIAGYLEQVLGELGPAEAEGEGPAEAEGEGPAEAEGEGPAEAGEAS